MLETTASCTIIVGIAIVIVSLILTVQKKLSYWKKRKIYHYKPKFILGNVSELLAQKKSFGDLYNDLYADAKSKIVKHAGFYFFATPQYVPIDLDIIKSILVKNFNHFMDRGVYYNEKDDPISAHLFTMEGNKWKNLRAKLSPTFTSGRIKKMFPTVVKITQELVNVMDAGGRNGIEMKELLARLTTDIIGNCAFGLECNSLKDPEAEFRMMGRRIFEKTGPQQIVEFFTFICPNACRFLRIKQQNSDVGKFFMDAIRNTIDVRESRNERRDDFIDLLIQIRNLGKLEDDDGVNNNGTICNDRKTLTIEEIAGQAFVFFIGGFETSSTVMSFCLYELSLNQRVQEKLRDEIFRALEKFDGRLTYEALFEMRYMDMVVNECLRKYPPVPVLNRYCVSSCDIQGSDLTIEPGTQVIVPVRGIHYDPEFYPEPLVFDPERFNEENKKTRHSMAFLPFGEGPRVCIGQRFGLLQTKIGLTMMLKSFKFMLNEKTPVPLVIDITQFLTTAVGGIFLNVEKI